jgi:hypothetical protein
MTRTEYNKAVRLVLAAQAAVNRLLETGDKRHDVVPFTEPQMRDITKLFIHATQIGRVKRYEVTDLKFAWEAFDAQYTSKGRSFLNAVQKDLDGVEQRNREYGAKKFGIAA